MTKRHMGAYLCAMLLFGTLGLFVRQAHVAGDVLAFLRTLIGAAFLGVLLLLQRHRIQKIGGRQLLYVLLSAAFLGFNWVFLFEAYAAATISIARSFMSMKSYLFSPEVNGNSSFPSSTA